MAHMQYHLKEIARHNNNESCWVVVHGKVYDVTDFITEVFVHIRNVIKIRLYSQQYVV